VTHINFRACVLPSRLIPFDLTFSLVSGPLLLLASVAFKESCRANFNLLEFVSRSFYTLNSIYFSYFVFTTSTPTLQKNVSLIWIACPQISPASIPLLILPSLSSPSVKIFHGADKILQWPLHFPYYFTEK
jgi:hypothetical protein